MKGKNNAGFSMVEVLVAIAILAGIAIPVCSSLVLSLRVNAKAEMMLQARIAVSSAVETLMAEGITEASEEYILEGVRNVKIKTTEVELDNPNKPEAAALAADGEEEPKPLCYEVTVTDDAGLVTVTTYIRAGEVAE